MNKELLQLGKPATEVDKVKMQPSLKTLLRLGVLGIVSFTLAACTPKAEAPVQQPGNPNPPTVEKPVAHDLAVESIKCLRELTNVMGEFVPAEPGVNLDSNSRLPCFATVINNSPKNESASPFTQVNIEVYGALDSLGLSGETREFPNSQRSTRIVNAALQSLKSGERAQITFFAQTSSPTENSLAGVKVSVPSFNGEPKTEDNIKEVAYSVKPKEQNPPVTDTVAGLPSSFAIEYTMPEGTPLEEISNNPNKGRFVTYTYTTKVNKVLGQEAFSTTAKIMTVAEIDKSTLTGSTPVYETSRFYTVTLTDGTKAKGYFLQPIYKFGDPSCSFYPQQVFLVLEGTKYPKNKFKVKLNCDATATGVFSFSLGLEQTVVENPLEIREQN